MTLYNNVGFNAERYENIATEISVNRRFWRPDGLLSQSTNLLSFILPKRRVSGLHVWRL